MSLSDINPQIDPGADAPADRATQNASTLKDTVLNNTAAAVNAVKDHPVTQNVTNGPVAQSVKAQANQTSNELGHLANARQVPQHTAATGQDLTQYHSFFYTLLSWEHPRATAIAFGSSVTFIFACRYLPILKWALKISWMTLGVVTLAEIAAKFVMGGSVASSVRPRRYYKIPKENLEAALEDLEQLINFFVIEFQRVVFAENIPVTALAFSSAFLSYYLIKILPFWGLTLLFTCVVYLAPLVYLANKDVIDAQIENASTVIGEQTAQVKELTAQHTSKGFESLKQYTNEYTAKASDLVGNARQKIPVPAVGTSKAPVKEGDFPSAPSTNLSSSAEHTKPVIKAPTEDAPIAASS